MLAGILAGMLAEMLAGVQAGMRAGKQGVRVQRCVSPDLYANQKDTSLHTAATEFHRHLLLLRNNHQEYREDGTH
ncbi:hypothetical protein llap_10278 [Limosa lapponica baueri]|uniref:Uncharacterized protein n=1 Tax=Limosa lapponica baueri TaxID=1758121 RepID=A0A2I0U078_LIMLA|nr:hypothetical protein llap_10278 [Limosa lapponica baueri]